MARNCEVDVKIGGIPCRISAPEGKVPDYLKRSRPEGHRPNFHGVPGGVKCVTEDYSSRIDGINPIMRASGHEDLVNGVRHSSGARRGLDQS